MKAKHFTIYQTKANLLFVEYSVKSQAKPRRHAISGTVQEAYDSFSAKGYTYTDKYNQGLI
jgi:hypothetical protein